MPILVRPARPLSAVLLAVLLLAGCNGSKEKQGEAAPAPDARPQRGGTAVIGWSAASMGVNELVNQSTAVTTEVIRQMFLQLVKEQPDFEEHPPTFAPLLAESYEFSPDHLALTFHLRKDAVWSDGVPVTADDVRWTWQAQTNPEVGWASAYMKEHITGVEVLDPHTVRFHFSHVYGKQLLDVNEGVILPKHAWEKIPFAKWRENGDWFARNLVVDGPFKVASWQPQQEVVLVRNERYFKKDRPYLDKVVVRYSPDASSLIAQLLSAEVDFVPQISATDIPRLRADPEVEVIPYWFRLYVCVIWNERNPWFADPEVRRALTLAIDRQTIVDTVYPGGTGRVGSSPIVEGIWAHDPAVKALPYDPAAARRILESRGWKDTDGDGVLDKDGKPFSFALISNAGNPQRNDGAVMIQAQLKKVGVRAEPRIMEFNSMVGDVVAGKFDAVVFGFTMDTSMDLTAQFASNAIEEGNFGAYKNPEIDRLMAAAMAKPEVQDARPILYRIQEILHRDQPVTFLWESQRLSAVRKRVRDVKPNVLFSLFNLEDWWVEPRR